MTYAGFSDRYKDMAMKCYTANVKLTSLLRTSCFFRRQAICPFNCAFSHGSVYLASEERKQTTYHLFVLSNIRVNSKEGEYVALCSL